MIFSVIKCLVLAGLAFLATVVCLIWLGCGYTASIILFACDESLGAIVALAIGCAPTVAALVIGWLFYRQSRRSL